MAVGVLALLIEWGTLAAVCFMFAGILVMVVAEKGTINLRPSLAAETWAGSCPA